MSSINKTIVLKLNKNWQAVGQSSVAKAIVDLSAGKSAYALDFDYEKDENGNYILDEHGSPLNDPISAIPVDWETWITLPVSLSLPLSLCLSLSLPLSLCLSLSLSLSASLSPLS